MKRKIIFVRGGLDMLPNDQIHFLEKSAGHGGVHAASQLKIRRQNV